MLYRLGFPRKTCGTAAIPPACIAVTGKRIFFSYMPDDSSAYAILLLEMCLVAHRIGADIREYLPDHNYPFMHLTQNKNNLPHVCELQDHSSSDGKTGKEGSVTRNLARVHALLDPSFLLCLFDRREKIKSPPSDALFPCPFSSFARA